LRQDCVFGSLVIDLHALRRREGMGEPAFPPQGVGMPVCSFAGAAAKAAVVRSAALGMPQGAFGYESRARFPRGIGVGRCCDSLRLSGRPRRPSPHDSWRCGQTAGSPLACGGLLSGSSSLRFYFLRRMSAARKAAKTTEIMPFMVKKAALRRERLLGLTRECS
jgi:hypothetical protein